MVSWRYLCVPFGPRFAVDGRQERSRPCQSAGDTLSVSPERHFYRVSAADKRCRVYPLDPHPDTAALYSGCTTGKCHAWVLPDNRHTASLVGLRGGWRHYRMKFFSRLWIHVCSACVKALYCSL
ncbi:uncharacterized protein TNCV_4668591 [Trichonephila clavipes]|nr:uncharacterized protein TNCV_4668591 [Trichonephila clavipes]